MEWFYDRLRTLKEAAGIRRLLLGTFITATITIVDLVAKNFEFMSFLSVAPTWAVVVIAVVLITLWWLLEFATKLRKTLTPKLKIIYGPEEPWVRYLTNGRTPRELPTSTSANIIEWTDTKLYYFRFFVQNPHPNTIVHGCRAFLIDVEFQENDVFCPTAYADTLQLAWASTDLGARFGSKDIPHLTNVYSDILSVDEVHNQVFPKWSQDQIVNKGLFERPGTYRLTVLVSSEDGGECVAKLRLEWTGRWDETKMWMIEDE